MEYCRTDKMIADIFTKALARIIFERLRDMLQVVSLEAGGVLKGYFQASNFALGNNSAQGSYAHESVRQCVSTHKLNPILTGYGLTTQRHSPPSPMDIKNIFTSQI